MKEKFKEEKGITLIALVVTIIVILILAGVIISTLTGNNGIINQASKAKIKNDVAALKEIAEVELASLQINEITSGRKLTVSEKIEKLIEAKILNEDRTFIQNSQYKLRYCGDIVLGDEVINNVQMDTQIIQDISPYNNENLIENNKIVKCYNGKIEKDNKYIKLSADEPPQGKKFGFWVDKYDNILSYYNNFMFNSLLDNVFVPVYIDTDTEITANKSVTIYFSNETTSNKLLFSVFSSVKGEEATNVKKTGLVATADKELANENDLVVENTNNEKIYIRGGSESTKSGFIWTWNKKNVGTENWYARGYVTITYDNGSTQTFYSPYIISAHK